MSANPPLDASTFCRLPGIAGPALRAWRERNGWSQPEAATLLGLAVRTLRSYEKSPGEAPRLVTLAVAYINTQLDAPKRGRKAVANA